LTWHSNVGSSIAAVRQAKLRKRAGVSGRRDHDPNHDPRSTRAPDPGRNRACLSERRSGPEISNFVGGRLSENREIACALHEAG